MCLNTGWTPLREPGSTMAAPHEHRPHVLASALQTEAQGGHGKAGNAGTFPVRHTPHPRRVCHIKGLNNIPICAVNDDVHMAWGREQLGHLEEDENPPAKPSAPSPAAPPSLGRGPTPAPDARRVPPRPHSAPCRKIQECFRTCAENPSVKKKEEFKVQRSPPPPKASSTAGSCSSEVLSTRAAARQNTFRIPNYLDQEIKILAKLCGILHTDSLADVIQWLLHASSKEKEWVSALIHAELSEINLLTHRRNASAGRAAQNWIPPAAKAPPSALAKLRALSRGRDGHRVSRASTCESEEDKEASKEAGHKSPLFIRRNNAKIPVVEYFSTPVSLVRAKTQESTSGKSAASRNTQQGQNLSPQRAFYPVTYQR
ncbi:uncharacterized protein C4orf17 homolog [Sorex araneus]|uniref:uncharacterized protein C4orf17 homolog n=1 Tax=Sorex araneus TaxID=42254 RepID=UPI00064B4460|nr:uncharacterized protein C4orf17 homolog [Sorex araneus]